MGEVFTAVEDFTGEGSMVGVSTAGIATLPEVTTAGVAVVTAITGAEVIGMVAVTTVGDIGTEIRIGGATPSVLGTMTTTTITNRVYPTRSMARRSPKALRIR